MSRDAFIGELRHRMAGLPQDAVERTVEYYSELIADLQTVPFFSDNRVVIVENPGFIVSPKVNDEPFVNALVSYFKKPNESTTFIIYIDQNIDRRRKALMMHFKDIGRIREASVEELMQVETINERVANEIYAFFHSDNTQKDGN